MAKVMEKLPEVSIIVPCYNQAHYLPVTLASIAAQTLTDWECLVIDDGSPDETALVAKAWAGKDSRFSCFRKDNGGLSSARNLGLAHARGRFIQFLDSDDVILPTKLEKQVHQLADCPSHTLSFCDYIRGSDCDIYTPAPPPAPYLPPTLEVITGVYELAADWETRVSIPPHCFLFNRIFFDEGIRFDENLANHEDWDCWMRIFIGSPVVKYVPEILAIYRYHHRSMCRNDEAMRNGYLQAIDKSLADPATPRDLQALLRAKRAEMLLTYEKYALRRQAGSRWARFFEMFHR